MTVKQPEQQEQKVFEQIGKMTRDLHETLQALGHDQALERTVEAIPDARERLAYVLSMTEQAVSRVLNAVDAISPTQEQAQMQARQLLEDWQRVGDKRRDSRDYQDTLARTREFLDQMDDAATANKAQLTEIVMAQEFQDLTGQVIKKIVDLAQDMESQLLTLLARTAPVGGAKTRAKDDSLLNGPAMETDKSQKQAFGSQGEVDSFLESLGF
ncbi:MAG: protein phosphatase CheZ [Betaproteobacteria bacterium]|nr:protein phosphatase CheZ [Betaproteobacteria bacterium]